MNLRRLLCACVRVDGSHVPLPLAMPPVQRVVHVAEGDEGDRAPRRKGIESLPQIAVAEITYIAKSGLSCTVAKASSLPNRFKPRVSPDRMSSAGNPFGLACTPKACTDVSQKQTLPEEASVELV